MRPRSLPTLVLAAAALVSLAPLAAQPPVPVRVGVYDARGVGARIF